MRINSRSTIDFLKDKIKKNKKIMKYHNIIKAQKKTNLII